MTDSNSFSRLQEILDDLREKCPWDKKQTIHSLRQLTIEETYELADAIAQDDWNGIKICDRRSKRDQYVHIRGLVSNGFVSPAVI